MPAAIPLAIAAGTAIGGIGAAKINSGAAKKSAEIQAQTTREGQTAQTKAADDTLAFQKDQAAADQARWEAAQRGNYNQYVAKSRAAQALGDTIGFHLPDPAAYVGTSSGAPSASAAPSGSAPPQWTPQYVQSRLAATGQDPSTFQYWLVKEPELRARGQQLGDPTYAETRLAQGDQPASGSPMASPTVASYLPQGTNVAALAPPPMQPFQLRSIDAFARR